MSQERDKTITFNSHFDGILMSSIQIHFVTNSGMALWPYVLAEADMSDIDNHGQGMEFPGFQEIKENVLFARFLGISRVQSKMTEG